MDFHETEIEGVLVVQPGRVDDDRGAFVNLFARDEFEARGLDTRIAQIAQAFNRRKGTLRGLHYQLAPYAQAKLVRCTRGAVYDVALDLRPESPTYRRWTAVELSGVSLKALYLPAGTAHGYQTLEAESEVLYQISTPYNPPSERGVRWDDPAFGVRWPLPPAILSERDATYPLWERTQPE